MPLLQGVSIPACCCRLIANLLPTGTLDRTSDPGENVQICTFFYPPDPAARDGHPVPVAVASRWRGMMDANRDGDRNWLRSPANTCGAAGLLTVRRATSVAQAGTCLVDRKCMNTGDPVPAVHDRDGGPGALD